MSSAFGDRNMLPAAFGDRDRDAKRVEAAERAARDAAFARTKKIASEAEAARIADATNFTSEDSYPALGGAKPTAKSATALNFKKTVTESAARPTVLREQRLTTGHTPTEPYYEPEAQEMTYAGDEEDEDDDGEFNTNLYATRRRGDKGIW